MYSKKLYNKMHNLTHIYIQVKYYEEDYEDIFNIIHKECIPNEYGGTAGPVDVFRGNVSSNIYYLPSRKV